MFKSPRKAKLILCCVLTFSCLLALVVIAVKPGLLPFYETSINIKINQALASGAAERDLPGNQDYSISLKKTNRSSQVENDLTGVDEELESNTPVSNTTDNKEETLLERVAPPPKDSSRTQPDTPAPEPAPAPSYSWGYSKDYHFQTEVIVTNNGSEISRDVRVHLPMLENSSPYQTTVLQSTNYPPASIEGRIYPFQIGDLLPGESKSIIADYAITLRSVSINSTNEIIEKARQVYNQYAGSGNCCTLATAFVNRCRELGLTARVVTGFARPQKGEITAGPLQGCRHSWAEYYVDGLGWLPVDLTFQYFSCLPVTSHIVETYSEQAIRVNFSGGKLSVSWLNRIQ
jgi:transglutaminase-like putative cysteine protease